MTQLQNRTTSEYFYVSKEDVYYLRLPGREVFGARSVADLEKRQGKCPKYAVVVVRTTTTVIVPDDKTLGREVTEWRVSLMNAQERGANGGAYRYLLR